MIPLANWSSHYLDKEVRTLDPSSKRVKKFVVKAKQAPNPLSEIPAAKKS